MTAFGDVPIVAGQVTEANSPTDFEVNGKHVVCGPKTQFQSVDAADIRISWSSKPYLGEPLLIYGRQDHHAHLIRAERVIFSPDNSLLHGGAIIDRVLAPQAAGSLLIRADGYPILLQPSTKAVFQAPLKSLGDVTTNVWIEYEGRQRPDGILVAEKAVFHPNTVSGREDRVRGKYDYDPSTISADTRQNSVKRAVVGVDPSQVPPSTDRPTTSTDRPTTQRVETVGEKLVPEYQRALPSTDPTKIPFKFQLIDDARSTDPIYFPSGLIFIPRQAVLRFQNEDQLAAYLATGIAGVIEKLLLRSALSKKAMDAAVVGSFAVLPVPVFVAALGKRSDLGEQEREQRTRVALSLLHDAGYELSEAPKAWWLLEAKKPAPLHDIPIPDASIYAYAILGSTWRDSSWAR